MQLHMKSCNNRTHLQSISQTLRIRWFFSSVWKKFYTLRGHLEITLLGENEVNLKNFLKKGMKTKFTFYILIRNLFWSKWRQHFWTLKIYIFLKILVHILCYQFSIAVFPRFAEKHRLCFVRTQEGFFC